MTARIPDVSTPVLVLNCKLGALAIMRTLGSQGVYLYGVDANVHSAGLLSRYCREKNVMAFDENREQHYLDYVLGLGKKIGTKALLIPTSDELSVFVAKYYDQLSRYFIFPRNTPDLVGEIISKEGMYNLACKHNVPTPHTLFPKNLGDVLEYTKKPLYPVMLKGIFGNRLEERTGKKMVLVHSNEELVEMYKLLEDPERANLMIQEYIPGGDDQIYIFNGYFDGNSDCLAAFTGHKIRQFPVHVGCASLGIVKWNQTVSDLTVRFMKEIGYRGILDIGYRLDPRDGQYKVLDINPRVGQAFRLFVAQNDMDVVKSLYLDLTGQKQPPIVPREGRKWMIEDYDIVSSLHYHWEGSLSAREWMRSFRGLEEGAWFSWKDPQPFFHMTGKMLDKSLTWVRKKL